MIPGRLGMKVSRLVRMRRPSRGDRECAMAADESADRQNTQIAALQVAIEGWLQRAESGDREAVLHPEAARQAQELFALIHDDDGADVGGLWLLGWLHWYRYLALPEGRNGPDLHAAVEMLTACFLAGAEPLPAPLLPILAEQASPIVVGLLQHALNSTDVDAVSAAVQGFRRILVATPAGHPARAGHLANLGGALQTRAERTGALEDLDEAVQVGRDAVAAIPADHPDRGGYLSNLGNFLQARFRRTGMQKDLDEAVRIGRVAVAATPADHPARAWFLSNLGGALQTRCERVGALEDLDEAVEVGRDAVAATPADHPDRAGYLSNLGTSLLTRFERVDALEDLDEAVEVGRDAVAATPIDHPSRARRLSNLGHALRARIERSGALEDINEATRTMRYAVAATASDHPDWATHLSSLGITLQTRFQRAGTLEDLDEAVQVGRDAVAATPTDHPLRANFLSSLGNALQTRYQRVGALEDADEAVQAIRDAVAATPIHHTDRARLSSLLGASLLVRFKRVDAREDLDEAVQVGRDAVAATPADHPDRAGYLSNLGAALQIRYRRAGALQDLDEAVQVGRGAVAVTPTDHPDRAGYLSNLGAALLARFERVGALEDLDEGVQAVRDAVGATATDHPDRGGNLSNLGVALRTRFQRLGMREDLDKAVEVFEQASNLAVAGASVRIRAGRDAGRLVASREPARAARLLAAAVRLLPQVAPRQLQRTDQQYALGGYAGLAADAAALALGDPSTPVDQRAGAALQLLEAGRAVLLSQAMHVRSDLTELTRHHPELADRFIRLRDQLDRTPDAVAATTLDDNADMSSAVEPNGRDRHRLAREFDDLLARIRAADGFASFGLPPSREQLLTQAAHGPVVVFNISQYRSDALLLTTAGITALPLPDLALDTVTDQVNTFHDALTITNSPDTTFAERSAAQQQLNRVLEWLWDNATGPVLNALGYHGGPAPGMSWPRVWWIPGGVLGLLPVHAAGYHAPGSRPTMRTALDRVVSSYTPTITALRHARRDPPAGDPATTRRALVVAMPTTPDLPGQNLDYVSVEARRVAAHLPGALILTEPGPADHPADGSAPTTATVLELLPTHAIAHFACHGLSDPTDPSHSRLLLHDHTSDPLNVAALAPLHLDHVRLAYLSACETALTRHTRLLDESIHLTTAFQLAGYPHVIGTLWAINDHIAADIADTFYTTLNPHATMNTRHAARALHDTMRAVRDQLPVTPSLWAAYLHCGA
ncbi:CHAT domain-containing protein [Nocardia sp. XZ_19_385]|uniref:CHAT domain-containing tetratricopeptide repeat protein n=1 Tax=Nocardia sp. XZ_19_385 TaxID=2769488 RepID=UPI00188FF3FF|nr:CHAT domain-containing protein [Nocardia sp. XZ_19_385]